MLGSIKAELKLVIAGNHDITLDGPYWRKSCANVRSILRTNEHDNEHDHNRAVEIMTGQTARDAGVTYLEEGLHTFTLSSGATFTIYTSPYQPEFCGWAFPYNRNEDRYNPAKNIANGVKEITGIKVPDFPGVDIMMTHGPPRGILDLVREGRMMAHVGCDALMTAASRARPQLYCFGHIHEGHGANLITWREGTDSLGGLAIETESEQSVSWPLPLEPDVVSGRQTLMVNAAIMTVTYKPWNTPWLVDLHLRTA